MAYRPDVTWPPHLLSASLTLDHSLPDTLASLMFLEHTTHALTSAFALACPSFLNSLPQQCTGLTPSAPPGLCSGVTFFDSWITPLDIPSLSVPTFAIRGILQHAISFLSYILGVGFFVRFFSFLFFCGAGGWVGIFLSGLSLPHRMKAPRGNLDQSLQLVDAHSVFVGEYLISRTTEAVPWAYWLRRDHLSTVKIQLWFWVWCDGLKKNCDLQSMLFFSYYLPPNRQRALMEMHSQTLACLFP